MRKTRNLHPETSLTSRWNHHLGLTFHRSRHQCRRLHPSQALCSLAHADLPLLFCLRLRRIYTQTTTHDAPPPSYPAMWYPHAYPPTVRKGHLVNLVAGAPSREKAAKHLSVRYLPRSRFGRTLSMVGKAAATTSLMSFTLINSLSFVLKKFYNATEAYSFPTLNDWRSLVALPSTPLLCGLCSLFSAPHKFRPWSVASPSGRSSKALL